MAHGFLAPQPVTGTGDISRYFGRKIDELIGRGVKKLEDVARDKFDQFKNQLFKERIRDTTYRSGRGGVEVAGGYGIGKNTAVGGGILGGSSVKGLLPKKAGIVNTQAKVDIFGRNATDIDRKEGKYLPTSDPDVAGGPKTSKGRYVNMPGVASASGAGLKADRFLNLKTGDVDVEGLRSSGAEPDYMKMLVKKGRQIKRSQGIAPTGETAPPITPDSGADIVAALSKQTQEIVRLADLTKEQTVSQQSMHNEQQAHADKLANRALARGEEKSLEKGSDLSGFTKAERFARLLPGAGGTGGGRGDGPIGGIGGKVALRKGVQQVASRGAARAGTRLAAKFGGKAAAKSIGKFGAKQAAKVGASAVGKSLGKKIPLVGLGLGAIFAAQRAMQGDFVGAGLELASGAASTVPGVGTAGSIGIDAALAARDMGMTPFAKGGIVTQPTSGLVGEAGKEGVFPLEGSRGKKTFEMFGEGIFEAQKKAKQEYADLQVLGLRKYFEVKGGFKAFGDIFGPIMKGIFGPVLGGLINKAGDFLGGALNNLFGTGGGQQNNLSPIANTGGLADFIGGLESGNDYTKMVGGAQDASVLGKTIDELMSEKGGQFAMGRYQIQMRTASEVLKNAGIDTSSFKFDQAGQDKIFELLLKRRGIDDFMSGKITEDQFAKNLSMEWAALPQDASGKGYYDGVGTNKSLTSFSSVKGQLSALKSSGSPFQATAPGAGGQNLAAAAQSLKGMSTADGPDGGQNGCVYAVNKVFNKAGITPPWGQSLYVPDAEKSMIDAGWQQVPYNQMQPGDVFVMKDQKSPPQAHIGVATDSQMILSNSSGKASMSWSSTAQGYNSYYGGQGTLYRMPGQQAVSTAQAASPGAPPTPPQKPDRSKFTGRSGAAAYDRAMTKYNAAMESFNASPVAAAPAPGSTNTGTEVMATSAQVASASMHSGGGTVINNNYYGGGNNQQTGGVPNGVTAGIGMENTGTSVFQDLRIRSLA